MADRTFAVFPVVWPGKQHNFGVLFRVTAGRARKIAGHYLPPAGRERRIEWRPSPHYRRADPALPADAVVRGRLIVAHVQGEDGKRVKLDLITTLEQPLEVLGELYRQRWHIELDIRSLKQTPAMAEKELLLAIADYNLVRSVQMAAAQQPSLEPQ